MEIILRYLYIIGLSVFGLQVLYGQGQGGPSLTGRVQDGESLEAIAFASVTLFRAADGAEVTTEYSGDDGSFTLQAGQPGAYFFEIDFLGYETYRSDTISLSRGSVFQAGTRSLRFKAEQLGEVVIEGRKSVIQTKIDRKVFNVAENITSQGLDALEMLNNVPSVEVDADGNISLRGNSNVTILVDGRPSGFSSSDALRQIPASAIDKIEIIANPTAKYDPDGMAGILNIVLKKNAAMGWNGNLQLNAGRGINNKLNGTLGANMRNGRWNVNAAYSANYGPHSYFGEVDRRIFLPDSTYRLQQSSEGRRIRLGHNLKFGTDFYATERNTLYTSFNYRNSPLLDNPETVRYSNRDDRDELYSTSVRNYRSADFSDGWDLNGGWQHKFRQPGQELVVDVQYSRSSDFEADAINEIFSLAGGGPARDPFYQRTRIDERNGILTLAADYTHPFSRERKLETGYKTIVRSIDNDFYSESVKQGSSDYTPDPGITNRFQYEEQVHAAYATYAQQWTKWTVQAGLRLEQALTRSFLFNTEETFNNDYFSFFPSLNVLYKLRPGEELMLNYSRRINRPRSHELNPFTDFADPFNLRRGNPFLLPEYIDGVELGYIRYWNSLTLNASVFYRHTNDLIRRFIEITDEGVQITTFQNLLTSDNIGTEMIATLSPLPWWNLNVTFNLSYSKVNTGDLADVLFPYSFGWNLQYNSTFKITPRLQLQVSGRYSSPFEAPQGIIQARYNVDLASRFEILNKRGSLGLRISDIFNTMQFAIVSQGGERFAFNNLRKWESRVVNLSFSYQFGRMHRPDEKRQGEGRDPFGDMDM